MLNLIMRKLRESKGLTQKEVSNILNISDARYNQYETGKRTPDHGILKELAAFYGCSLDYLLGNSNSLRADLSDPLFVSEETETIKKAYENLKVKISTDKDLSAGDKETLIGLIDVSLSRIK